MKQRILLVASELQPLMKTGGLADAVAGLATALHQRGHDLHVLMPAYADTLARLHSVAEVAGSGSSPGLGNARLLETRLSPGGVPVWLLDAPGFSDRPGNPYTDAGGQPASDNHLRFGRLCRVAALLAGGRVVPGWRADVIHSHDWHAGLVPVYAMLERIDAAIVFTIHNLAYHGLFPFAALETLGLPPWLWHYRALEYRGELSFIKGGLYFADRLATVSEGYAKEILTREYGEGLEGLLRERRPVLRGIVNGLDTQAWDPRTDVHISANYSPESPDNKRRCREALREEMALDGEPGVPVIALLGRLTGQKGIDLLVEALPELMKAPLQLLVLGSGEHAYERQLRKAADHWPGRMAVRIGYDEALAHRMIAGADMVLMPSRFEPCGLVQLQALRYGTVPVVRHTGGLGDTVIDADRTSLKADTATGVCFRETSSEALIEAVLRAVELYRDGTSWHAMMRRGMVQAFSWDASAVAYERVYVEILAERGHSPWQSARANGTP